MTLNSTGKVDIRNRGTVFLFDEVPDLDPLNLHNKEVEIDGTLYRVKAVEAFATLRAIGSFGLLVEKV